MIRQCNLLFSIGPVKKNSVSTIVVYHGVLSAHPSASRLIVFSTKLVISALVFRLQSLYLFLYQVPFLISRGTGFEYQQQEQLESVSKNCSAQSSATSKVNDRCRYFQML